MLFRTRFKEDPGSLCHSSGLCYGKESTFSMQEKQGMWVQFLSRKTEQEMALGSTILAGKFWAGAQWATDRGTWYWTWWAHESHSKLLGVRFQSRSLVITQEPRRSLTEKAMSDSEKTDIRIIRILIEAIIQYFKLRNCEHISFILYPMCWVFIAGLAFSGCSKRAGATLCVSTSFLHAVLLLPRHDLRARCCGLQDLQQVGHKELWFFGCDHRPINCGAQVVPSLTSSDQVST